MKKTTDYTLNKTIELIKQQLKENKVVLYMKGSISKPQCGFSANIVKIIQSVYAGDIKAIDVLEYSNIRKALPIYSEWPTFPQLYINDELIGGYDIVSDMFENNQLKQIFE